MNAKLEKISFKWKQLLAKRCPGREAFRLLEAQLQHIGPDLKVQCDVLTLQCSVIWSQQMLCVRFSKDGQIVHYDGVSNTTLDALIPYLEVFLNQMILQLDAEILK